MIEFSLIDFQSIILQFHKHYSIKFHNLIYLPFIIASLNCSKLLLFSLFLKL